MRGTSDIGHLGMGDLEYSLRAADQLYEVRGLASAGYDASWRRRQPIALAFKLSSAPSAGAAQPGQAVR
jgi:hypothetical protein